MSELPDLLPLIEAGRHEEAAALLEQGVRLFGAVGPRSARAALAAAKQICGGDFMKTVYFMNSRHPWLGGQTVLERAEQSDEDADFVLDMIGAIEAGVYV